MMSINDDVIFLSAREVYNLASNAYTETLVKNRKELRDLIIRTAELGQFRVVWDKDLSDIIKTWLIEYGYKVEDQGKMWVVSWDLQN